MSLNIVPSTLFLSVTANETRQCLSMINKTWSRGGVIIGALNARHVTWDTRSNNRGPQILRWAKQERWMINPPREATTLPPNLSQAQPSIIDIALLKGITPKTPVVDCGAWDGSSDHLQISVSLNMDWTTQSGQKSANIPKCHRFVSTDKTEHRAYTTETTPQWKLR